MRRFRAHNTAIVVGLLVWVLAACGGGETSDTEVAAAGAGDDAATEDAGGGTQAAASGLDEVCAAGVDEGGFEYWATFEDENWQRIYEPFAQAYPGIDIELLALRGESQLQRIITADSAGQQIPPDVVSSGMDEIIAPIAERDLIDTEVDWSRADVAEDIIHPGTNSVRVSRTAIGLAYNTETTSPDDLPDTWEGLIDEKYAGQVVVDPRGRPFSQLGLAWEESQLLDYVERLMDVVDPIVIEGGTAGMTAVLTGEAMVSTGGRSDSALELQAEGAPIAIKYLDVIPTEHDYNALIAGAENQNAAMCFMGWLASPEGTAVYQEVEFKQNVTIPEGAPEDANYVSVENTQDAEVVNEYGESIRQIIEGS